MVPIEKHNDNILEHIIIVFDFISYILEINKFKKTFENKKMKNIFKNILDRKNTKKSINILFLSV